ncbi:MAG: serine--tRNA ligase [Chitinophagales bacterium]|nr:serine--tRNA ligase [Chitinophagales bacterium]OJV29119.1 MAG: serine--tRNA ligase [Bacteroidetes bacterium 37-13]
MLEISVLRSNAATVKEKLAKKYFAEINLVDEILVLDEKRRQIQKETDDLLAEQNLAAKSIGALMQKGEKEAAETEKAKVAVLKEQSKQKEELLAAVENEQQQLLVRLPNLPHESVPEGKTPEQNVVVRESGNKPNLSETALPHWDIAKKYDLFDLELGVKITGAGFPVYKGKGAKLQRALISFFLDKATEAGYTEVIPPFIVNESSAFSTGQLPDKEGQMYYANLDGFYLIPTAEVPVTNIVRGDIFNEKDLPLKYCAYSPCFRREAGSYGKDVRGLNRVHQFDKVEIVQIANPDKSYQVLEEMLAHVENILNLLNLPYRILRLCGGDMSFTSALTFDFEVWSGAQKRWLEVSSVSNFETFQSNRLKTRFRDENKKTRLVHTLNGSALALPRIVAALLENNQTENGVAIPEVLQKYTGFSTLQ